VRGEQHQRPGEQQRRRVVPREEERLALVDNQLQVVAEPLRRRHVLLLFHLGQQHGQQAPAVGRRRAALVGDLPAPPDGLRQHGLQLTVQPPDLSPVLAREVPAQRRPDSLRHTHVRQHQQSNTRYCARPKSCLLMTGVRQWECVGDDGIVSESRQADASGSVQCVCVPCQCPNGNGHY
jgi:hypothetical protein